MAANTEQNGRDVPLDLFDELVFRSKRKFANCRRTERRYPLFFSVSVQVGQHSYSAFTRDISDTGIGLLHSMDLPCEDVVLKIPDRSQRLRIRIEWCEPVGEGWYISGGRRADVMA